MQPDAVPTGTLATIGRVLAVIGAFAGILALTLDLGYDLSYWKTARIFDVLFTLVCLAIVAAAVFALARPARALDVVVVLAAASSDSSCDWRSRTPPSTA